jgi:serine/threonine protein kinase
MSPEQEQGQEIDTRTDIYALGALLSECLTGRSPRPSDEPDTGKHSGVHLSGAVVPEGWIEIIDRATSARARDRYPDTKAMREAIAALGESIRPGSRAPRGAAPPEFGHPLAQLAAAGAGAGLTGWAGGRRRRGGRGTAAWRRAAGRAGR